MKKYSAILIVTILFLEFICVNGQEIPHQINYQGILKDSEGNIVPDGNFNLTFNLYDAESSGTELWSETKLVSVTGGIVNTQLGSVTPLDVPFDNTYWLGISINAGNELTPRVKLTAVPYSFMTIDVLDASITTDKLHDGAVSANKLTDNSVTTGKILNETITAADIADGQLIKSINGIRDSVHILAGSNVTITPDGNDLTISSTGGSGSFTLPYVGTLNSPNNILMYITNSAYSGTNCAVEGRINSTAGYGIYGVATSTSGSNYGVYGRSYSSEGTGVYGEASSASGTSYGMYAKNNSTTGFGLYSENTATSGINYGIFAGNNSISGRGIGARAYSTTGTTYGIYGASNSTGGCGIYGTADATSGSTYGIYGRSISNDGYGVYGTGPVWGVVGKASATNTATTGIYGVADSPTGTGIYGLSPHYGIVGQTLGTTTSDYGVYGIASGSAWAGHFEGGIAVSGMSSLDYCSVANDFICWGSKSAAVDISTRSGSDPNESADYRAVYCVEATEVWLEDFGYGNLNNGVVTVQMDDTFLKTINTNVPYHIFITPYGNCNQLYVTNRGESSFTVIESNNGTSSTEFSYRIVAKRHDYEDRRLESVSLPQSNFSTNSKSDFLKKMGAESEKLLKDEAVSR